MSVDIINDDYQKAIEGMPDALFDCILTDPPYGETSLKWDKWPEGWPGHIRRLLKPSGSMWVFGSQRMFFDHAAEFRGWKLSHDVVWEKHNGSGFLDDRFRRVHELALHFYRDDAKWSDVYKKPQFTNDAQARTVRRKSKPAHWTGERGASSYKSEDGGPRLMRSVLFARSEHGRAEHPTQKPIAIIEPLLLYACPPGGRVLDLFSGSGTTGIVARRHGMDAVLIEADEDYVRVIEDRIREDAPLFGGNAA